MRPFLYHPCKQGAGKSYTQKVDYVVVDKPETPYQQGGFAVVNPFFSLTFQLIGIVYALYRGAKNGIN